MSDSDFDELSRDQLEQLEAAEQFGYLSDDDPVFNHPDAIDPFSLLSDDHAVFNWQPPPTRPSTPRNREEQLKNLIDGDLMPKMDLWTDRMREVFFSKHLSNSERLELTLFLLGNGLSPDHILEWYKLRRLLSNESAYRDVQEIIRKYRNHLFPILFKYYDCYNRAWTHLNGELCEGLDCWCKRK